LVTLKRGPEDTAASFPIEVRRLESVEEYRQCEKLQARVWGPDDVVRVPALVMVAAHVNGGFAFGAFAGGPGGQLVGFVLASPGLSDAGHVKQCSILMAVDPEFQNSGVGYQLKSAQREAALAQGMDLITWTFDPLASPNAYLNLNKLGCVATRYFVDLYGTAESGLNAGLPTDRLLAEWRIREPGVVGRLAGAAAPPPVAVPMVNEVVLDAQSCLPSLRGVDLARSEPLLLVEIPESIRAIKQADMGLARHWRGTLREVFQSYFARSYHAAGFYRLPGNGRVRHCFLLEHTA
jgi:predicted GNAT superfamily acetyltransferase